LLCHDSSAASIAASVAAVAGLAGLQGTFDLGELAGKISLRKTPVSTEMLVYRVDQSDLAGKGRMLVDAGKVPAMQSSRAAMIL
jgi:hypothetical protein